MDKDVLVPALHHEIKTVDLVTSQAEGGVNAHSQLLQEPAVCVFVVRDEC